MTNSFYSPQKRDFLDLTVPKDQRFNPGPGTYDTQIQDKLKILNHQLSSRYQLKPFGFGAARFEYQIGSTVVNQRNTIDFNQMISVKDREITNKREAFRDTIQMHKKFANSHVSSNFASTSDRFPKQKHGRSNTIDITTRNDVPDYHTTSRSGGFDIQASEVQLQQRTNRNGFL